MTTASSIATAVAITLALPILPAQAAGSATTAAVADRAEDPAPSLRLEIDASGLGGYPNLDPEVYATMARDALTNALTAKGYDVLDPNAPASGVDVLRVALGWRDFDASIYTIRYYASPEGGETTECPEHLCEHCSDDDLIEALGLHLPEALDALVVEATVDTPPPDEPPPEDPPPDDPPPDKTENKQFPVLAGAGIGLAVAGLGGLVAGGVLVAKGEQTAPGPGGPVEVETTDFRPPGYALLAGGGALLVTGAVLIAIGFKKRAASDDQARARRPRFTFSPAITPRGAHLGLTARF